MIIKIIFWISALLIMHTYVFYPLLLVFLDKIFKKPGNLRNESYTPEVSVLMAVYNEEAVIRKKIESLFSSEYPVEKMEVLVGSDSSNDSTIEILTELEKLYPGLKIVRLTQRIGKPAVINRLLSIAKGDILILTDANVIPDKKAIRKLVLNFSDKSVGLVDSRLINTGIKRDGISLPEVAYNSMEMKLKNIEGRLWGTMMGPFGGFYAIRKVSGEPILRNILADDFWICMNVIKKHEKAISDTEAIVYEDVSNSLREEFLRKVRISAGNFQNLEHFAFLLLKPFSIWSFCFISHKILRWITPFLWLIAVTTNILLYKSSDFFSILIILQVIFLLLPAFDFLLKKLNLHLVPVRFLTHLLIMNIALFAGFIKYVKELEGAIGLQQKGFSKMNEIKLNTVDEAIEDIKQGKLLIVVDDEDRENEGDFICSAELITPEIVNFMAKHGRGLICAPLPEERCEEMELDLMVGINTSLQETQFTVSVDFLSKETTTGVSAKDRAQTIKALVDPATKSKDLGRPGHIFPLKSKAKGVLRRAGHTEAVVDLTRMAGLQPGGALVEIMNDDGTMARMPELLKISKKFGIKIITIKDLITYRLERESIIEKGEKVKLPTSLGEFEFIPFRQITNGIEHAALIKGTWTKAEPVIVRVHSSCFTGDIFHSLRCDCGPQLDKAMEMVEAEGKGVVIYLSQEGRGIGLLNKIKSYKLQEEGMDTVQANLKLGFEEDERDYGVGASIMRELGLGKVRLISNNPVKRAGLEGYGIKIVETIPLIIPPNPFNEFYLETKASKMGHTLTCYKHGMKD